MRKLVVAFLLTVITLQASDHKHHIEAFVGGAKEYRDQDETTHVLGLEYQYTLNKMWSVGAEIEALGDETARERAYILPVTLHLGHWHVFAGPGYEDDGEHGAFLLRVGSGYAFEFAHNYTITPKLMVDVIGGHGPTLIGGLAFGYGF